jgi:hypothetical protein
MQALVRGLYYFIGNGVGSILGGLIIDSQGGGRAGFHLMYRFGGVAMVAWSCTWHLLMWLDHWCHNRRSNGTKDVESEETAPEHERSEPRLLVSDGLV